MNIPENLRYTKTHEWVRIEGDTATVGITEFAQEQLGDLTFVELPAVGRAVTAGEETAVVESVKAASDIYAPLPGTVTEVNQALNEHPELINTDPYDKGWIFRIKLSDKADQSVLLDAAQYAEIAGGN